MKKLTVSVSVVIFFVLIVIASSLISCSKSQIQIERSQKDNHVTYIDLRQPGTSKYFHSRIDGQLFSYVIHRIGSDAASYEINEKAEMEERKASENVVLPIDSKEARELQKTFEEVCRAYSELVPGYYPESHTGVRPEMVSMLKKWVAEYATNNQAMDEKSQWQSYLSERALRASYNELNWREKNQVWATPEKIMGLSEIVQTKSKYPRPLFEEYLNMERENDGYQAFRIDLKRVETEYFNNCKERGLTVFDDAWEWGPPSVAKK